MAYKVILWGTGFVGKMVIGELLQNPEYELVGVIGHFPEEIGRDVGELIGADPVGLESSGDVDAVLSRHADAVAYYGPTAEFAQENIENICKALRAGKNVVSTAMTPWVYHKARHCPQSQVRPVEEACREAGVTCFTTGIDPGFMNDIVPLTLMGVCGRVDGVRIQELQDYSMYTGSTAGMALGVPMEKTGILENSDVLIYAWGPTIYMIADAVGAELEKVDTTYEKWATPERIEYVKGVIEPGNCAAVHFEIRGWVSGRPAIVIEHVNRIGNAAAPYWPRSKMEENDSYRIMIQGSPNISMEAAFRGEKDDDPSSGGCMATGMRAIHSIPAVCAAEPGMVSALDLPLTPGRGTLR
jgi:4-hydroxy-tetrahydrodipicolinate reductase